MDFVHLHVHSHYSLLDGGNRIRDLVTSARDLGMTALALTDHGNLYGAVDFYREAVNAGIKPILGMEAYIAPHSRFDRKTEAVRVSDQAFHLLLLAMNETGWANLMRLSSRAFLEGYYYKPRVDRELLAEFNAGLVCTSACLGGEIPQALLDGRVADAERIAGEYRDIFGRDRFFIELQNQDEPEQVRVNPMLVDLARRLGVGLVGTNDVHFLRRDDKRSHEVLTCISVQKKLTDPDILRYSTELYLKSPAEMGDRLKEWPEAIRNTARIADMCDLKLDFSRKHLPFFRSPDGATPDDHLRAKAYEGLSGRFGQVDPPPEYLERLDRELKVIEGKGYSSYFLIIDDFVRFARDHHIPASPRGSGVATLLGYALGISPVDPVKYGLLFERFTDPQRQEDPDVDIDICQEGRARVMQYVREKYGHVAQIITYGTLKARAAIRDCGRVLGWELQRVEKLSKMVPEGPRSSLALAMGRTKPKTDDDRKLVSAELQQEYERDPEARELLNHALTLEGLARHAGVHAAGVVVCDQPLETLVPVCRQAGSPDVITQWDGPTCEKAGLMKMDLLGLKTLTVLQRARDLVAVSTGVDHPPDQLPLDDDEVFALFRQGQTDGVFQFESEGMKKALQDMQPNRIEDLIAANAMYRPGPMELIPLYCRRKKKLEAVELIHPLVDDILAETYGIMVYQEQVMQVLNRLGGLPMSRALTLIKAISKKLEKKIAAEEPAFIEGAMKNGVRRAEAERIFALILKFAGYGFNKAHSTGYALMAYQTAWFKRHHPREFWAATLTYESDAHDKLVQYMNDARRMGMVIAPPDINTSGSDFTVDGELIRFGLKAVKGVGEAAVQAVIRARTEGGPFGDLFDFCLRVDAREVNRSAIEAMIKCGAFDGAGGSHRAAMIAALDSAIQSAQAEALDRARGQMSLFGDEGGAGTLAREFPRVAPWSQQEMIEVEKATIGVYVTAHPLDRYQIEREGLNWPRGLTLAGVGTLSEGAIVALAVQIAAVRERVIRSGRSAGKTMLSLTLEDPAGRIEAVLFPDDYAAVRKAAGGEGLVRPGILQEGALVQVRGTVERRERGGPGGRGGGENGEEGATASLTASLILKEVRPMETLAESAAEAMVIGLRDADMNPEGFGALKGLLARHRGTIRVMLHLRPPNGACRRVVVEAAGAPVKPTRELIDELIARFGPTAVAFDPKPVALAARPRWRDRNGG
jgi:DNA polymerase III subunit alpha